MLPPKEGTANGLAWGEWPGADGAPLLFLPGISSTLCAFLDLAANLPGRRRVAYDMRGRGRSTQDGPAGIVALAADVRSLARDLELVRPVLVGHSLGAYVAVRAAAAWPGGITALVLLDGGMWAPSPLPDALLEAALATSLGRLERRFTSVDEYEAYWATSALAIEPTAARRAGLERDLIPLPGGGFRAAMTRDRYLTDLRTINADPDRNTLLAQVDAPVLLVRAPYGLLGDEASRLIPDPVLAAARPHVASLEVVDLAAANHNEMLDGTDGAHVAARIATFLATHGV
jgi:pimeloyl-ACP methyl ester carboxylesterase